MNDKIQNITVIAAAALLMTVLSVWCWLKPQDGHSYSERRPLEQRPEISSETLSDGSFMDNFELYAMDQFPVRDTFRSIKAFSELKIFMKSDNNGLFVKNGCVFKNEYPLNPKMLDFAADKFQFIYSKFLSDTNTNVYFSIIPDKNYFLPDSPAILSIDYQKLIQTMKNKTPYMSYIDIADIPELDDYYRTDTHWRQEKITGIAEKIASEMNVNYNGAFTENKLDTPFYGVFSGQLGLPVKPDNIVYLTNDAVENCIVTDLSSGKSMPVYNMEKADGKDPYEIFLSGAEPLIKIENPLCDNNRKLIMFRDSFGSSLAPLLIGSYSEITLVDIRYMQSAALDQFIRFDDQDVLFIYSTLLLNSSTSFK